MQGVLDGPGPTSSCSGVNPATAELYDSGRTAIPRITGAYGQPTRLGPIDDLTRPLDRVSMDLFIVDNILMGCDAFECNLRVYG